MNRISTFAGACGLVCALAFQAAAQGVSFQDVSQGQLDASATVGRRVIRDGGELLASPFAGLLPPGSVDFSQDMLIGVVEANPSGAVFEVSVAQIVWRITPGSIPGGPSFSKRHMEVRLSTRPLAPGNPGLAKTLPYHLIKLPRAPRTTQIVFVNAAAPTPQPGLTFSVVAEGPSVHWGTRSGYHVIRSRQDARRAGLRGALPAGFLQSFPFAQEMLVAVVLDSKAQVGHSIVIEKIRRENAALTIDVRHNDPGPNAPLGFVAERPFQIVRVRRFDVPADFRTRVVDPSGGSGRRVRGTVSVQSSLGVKLVSLDVNGKRLYVRPAAFAQSLEPLIGEEVEVRGRLQGNQFLARALLSPTPYAATGALSGAGQSLRFQAPGQARVALRGGLRPLLSRPHMLAGTIELEGYHFAAQQTLKVTGVKGRVRRDAQLLRAGQVVGSVQRGQTVTALTSSGDRVLVRAGGASGYLRLRNLSFTQGAPSGPAITIPFGTSGGITVHLPFGQ